MKINCLYLVLSYMVLASIFMVDIKANDIVPYKAPVDTLFEEIDSLLLKYEKEYEKSLESGDSMKQVKVLRKLTSFHMGQSNYQEALNYISLALAICDKNQYAKEKAYFLDGLSDVYWKFGDEENSSKYVFESLEINRKGFLNGEISAQGLLNSYLNVINVKKREQDLSSALLYLDSCFNLADTTDLKNRNNLIRVKASVLTSLDSLDAALDLLLPIDISFNRLTKNDSIRRGEVSEHILISAGIARVYREKKINDLALKYYLKSLNLLHEINEKLDFQQYLYEEIGKLYADEGNFRMAYKYLFQAYDYTNSFKRASSEKNRGVFQIRDLYKEKLDQKEKELILERLEVSKRDKSIMRFKLLLVVLVVCVIAGVIFFKYRTDKNKHKIEQRSLTEKASQAQDKVRYKNKELASYSLQLLERDDLLDQFSEYLQNDKSKNAKSLITARKQLLSNTWEEFEKRFVEVNASFYEKLSKKYPDLSIGDLKYCALLKLNLRGKEIAKLLGVTEKSVHMARYRLRKKFQLETNDNLEEFLNKI